MKEVLSHRRLQPTEARFSLNPADLQGGVAPEIPIEMVGQDRVEKALKLALSSAQKCHIAVLSDKELSPEILKRYLEQKIDYKKASAAVKDYGYVHNFQKPDAAFLLEFPAGQGRVFKSDIEKLKKLLKKRVTKALTETEEKIRENVKRTGQVGMRAIYDKLEADGVLAEWEKRGVRFDFNDRGMGWRPLTKNGRLMAADEFDRLPEAEQDHYFDVLTDIKQNDPAAGMIQEFLAGLNNEMKQTMGSRMARAEKTIFEGLIGELFKPLMTKYAANEKIMTFLNGLLGYTKKNPEPFLASKEKKGQIMTNFGPIEMDMPFPKSEQELVPFEVNLMTDNRPRNVPIIVETNPTYAGLLGKIERKLFFGEMEIQSDHTMIKPGAIHRANGGFLILDLNSILATKHWVYLGLMQALKEKRISIRDYTEEVGIAFSGKTLSPEPVPLNLTVIGIINPQYYYYLWQFMLDKEFMELFVKAEFDREIKNEAQNIGAYAAWLGNYGLEPTAKAGALEYLLRENENQQRFSWDVRKLKTLVEEAGTYAREEGSKTIGAQHVKKAIEEKIYRADLTDKKWQREIEEGQLVVETTGEKIGQINGLSVYLLGEYEFGKPCRISVTAYKGSKGLINIEKEAETSGSSHTKGIETLKGFFNQRYGKDKELNFEGRVVFEQSYGPKEGPSASAAELFALISSLSGKPIKQGMAVTGTVDQEGNIGAIGGVNQKIEGFFKLCQARGLSGDQGVIIPRSNLKNLMLQDEVVAAISDRRFHVYPIETVAEGIAILTGLPMKEIDRLVNKKLQKWSGGLKLSFLNYFFK